MLVCQKIFCAYSINDPDTIERLISRVFWPIFLGHTLNWVIVDGNITSAIKMQFKVQLNPYSSRCINLVEWESGNYALRLKIRGRHLICKTANKWSNARKYWMVFSLPLLSLEFAVNCQCPWKKPQLEKKSLFKMKVLKMKSLKYRMAWWRLKKYSMILVTIN